MKEGKKRKRFIYCFKMFITKFSQKELFYRIWKDNLPCKLAAQKIQFKIISENKITSLVIYKLVDGSEMIPLLPNVFMS